MTILTPLFGQDRTRLAAMAGETAITYGRLCDDIDSMAYWLLANGLEPGQLVTIHSRQLANPDYWDWIMHLGAIRAGLTQSTGALPPSIVQSGLVGPYAAAIGYLDALPGDAAPNLRLPFDPRGKEPLGQQMPITRTGVELEGLETHAIRLMATSGTTGLPKIVRWDSGLFERRLKQVRELRDIDADTRLLTALGLITTTGLRYPLAAWQKGGFVYLGSLAGRETDLRKIVYSANFIATSPFRMQGLLDAVPGPWAGKSERVIELFGGRVPPDMRDEILARCCDTLNMSYGATEVGRMAAGDTALIERHPGAAGMIEEGATIEIVDRRGNPLPAGQEGIVRLKSDLMVEGYLELETDPRSPFRDGWFYPGDLGILDEDGMFALAGRQAETINLSGAKYSPLAFEQRIAAIAEVQDVCAVALNASNADILAVAVVCAPEVDLNSLRNKVAALLPPLFPPMIIRVANIPRNGMGRIPRRDFAAELSRRIAEAVAGQVRPDGIIIH